MVVLDATEVAEDSFALRPTSEDDPAELCSAAACAICFTAMSAALGGASGRSGNTTYTDGVYKFDTSVLNPTSAAVSLVIAGGINTGVPGGPSGLQSPKYLQFGYNFVPADDPGAPGVPEPSGIIAGLGVLGMVGGGALRARRRRNR